MVWLEIVVWVLLGVSVHGLRVGIQAPPGSSAFQTYAPAFGFVQNVTGIPLEVIPFTNDADLQTAAVNGSVQLTFSTATPTYCIILPTNLQPIATVVSIVDGQVTASLAAVVVVPTESPIVSLQDVRGRVIGAGQLSSLTLTQAPWGLLAANNISFFGDTRAVIFLGTAQNIIAALYSGAVDVGFLPANFADSYNVSADDFRILDPRMDPDYPLPVSTPVFSSQVIGTLPSVNSSTRNALAKAFLDVEPNATFAVQGGYYGFGTPQSFLTIRKLLQTTGLLPANAEGCVQLNQLYDSIPCPPGYNRGSMGDIEENCIRRGVVCPANASCVCSPCRRQPTPLHVGALPLGAFVAIVAVLCFLVTLAIFIVVRRRALHVTPIAWRDIELDENPVLGHASMGLVLKARYSGSLVAVKRAYPRLAEGRSVFDFDDLEFERHLIVGKRESDLWSRRHKRVWACMLECFGVRTERRRRIQRVAAMAHVSRRHSNVVPTLGVCFGADNLEVLIVNLHMERGSLLDLINNPSVTIDASLLYSIARDVAAAMLWFHSRNPPTISANLHPSHILMDSNLRAHMGSSLKRSNEASAFTAPELLDGQRCSKASDVYAYGMLLYMLVFRREPFEGEDPMAVFRAVRDSQGFVQKRPDIESAHPIVKQLLEGCWDSDPAARPLFPQICADLASVGRRSLADDLLQKIRQGRTLLEQVYPPSVARALEEGKIPPPEKYPLVTIFFSDIVGFTRISSNIGADEVMKMLHMVYSGMDELAKEHGVFKVETIGDAWMGVTNLRHEQPDHAARMGRFALDIVNRVSSMMSPTSNRATRGDSLHIRIGMHSGPVTAGIVGTQNPRYALFGDTVGNLTSSMLTVLFAGALEFIHASFVAKPVLFVCGQRKSHLVSLFNSMCMYCLQKETCSFATECPTPHVS